MLIQLCYVFPLFPQAETVYILKWFLSVTLTFDTCVVAKGLLETNECSYTPTTGTHYANLSVAHKAGFCSLFNRHAQCMQGRTSSCAQKLIYLKVGQWQLAKYLDNRSSA